MLLSESGNIYSITNSAYLFLSTIGVRAIVFSISFGNTFNAEENVVLFTTLSTSRRATILKIYKNSKYLVD